MLALSLVICISTYDDAFWVETFQVQQMQQSFHTKGLARKAFQNSHDIDQHNDCVTNFEYNQCNKTLPEAQRTQDIESKT